MTLPIEPADWRESLSAGDIVAFSFPSKEDDAELEKDRPGLVLSVDRSGAEPVATIAYGTSRGTRANTGLELHVRSAADVAAAGLHRPTRFVGARRVTVPLTSVRFVTCGAGTAVLGRLPEQLHARLAQVASRSGGWQQRGPRRRHLRRRRRMAAPVATGARGVAQGNERTSIS